MQSQNFSRQPFVRREQGIALIVTLMILMLVSVLMVGFVASIIADTRASGLDRDQTQAYAASHAGLEQITSELSDLFNRDPSPSGADVAALRAAWPDLAGYEFIEPGGGAGSGYMVGPRFPALVAEPALGIAVGDPLPEDRVNGSMITAGPYQGFRGIITPYDITVTARACPGGLPCDSTRGGAEVRMRRTLQTVSIPVFQFGMFSETDLGFHAGAEDFVFQGRVHTNGNLFLAAAGGGTLTIGDRITAAKDVIRTHLTNGLLTTSGYTGNVRIPTLIASLPANNKYRDLKISEGSLKGTLGSAINPNWRGLTTGAYLSNIRNSETGAKKLDLPLVADLDGDKKPDALPIDLIRRPAPGELSTSIVYPQRFFAFASLRILLSDTEDEIKGLPTVLQTAPGAVNLTTGLLYGGALPPLTRPPLAAAVFASAAAAAATGPSSGNMPSGVYKSWDTVANGGAPLLGGWIKIEMRRNDNNAWQDVTEEILALGIAGRNLANYSVSAGSRWNTVGSVLGTSLCPEPNPDAIIRLQRVRDVPTTALGACGVTGTGYNITAVSLEANDYWPNTLYDPREGHTRDGLSDTTNIVLGGVMHYIELDVNNLRRWLLPAGSPGKIPGVGELAKNENGYIVYFSDRRNNKDDTTLPARETGEYGWEETVNLGNTAGTVLGTLDPGEDVNDDGVRDIYGGTAKASALGPNPIAPLNTGAQTTTVLTGSTSRLVARANKAILFRRALKIVNGGITTTSNTLYTCSAHLPAPCNNIIAPGLTIVSENPVYLQGNYNATAASVNAEPNVAAAIIADAVTVLSNRWNDIRSFNSPTNARLDYNGTSAERMLNWRQAETTGYRVALVTGKTLPFPKPSYADASFGSDGGVHNFLRSLEDWNSSNVWQRYRGSMVSFFISRQATGSFKCCDADTYVRGDRDWQFDTDFLLPARLPPGTPMFRDVNTLTFRQLLRPTQ